MNRKGFTLIELIAVVVIMSIIAIIATPNIINMMDKGKKEQYVADAKEFISKATYMYKQEKYKEKFKEVKNGETITLNEVNGIKTEDKTDPYGFKYDLNKSVITFEAPSLGDGVQERVVKITLMSKESEENGSTCYYIENVEKTSLETTSVKEGTYDANKCGEKK